LHSGSGRTVGDPAKAMRDGDDPMSIFERLTKKTAEDLWKVFIAANP